MEEQAVQPQSMATAAILGNQAPKDDKSNMIVGETFGGGGMMHDALTKQNTFNNSNNSFYKSNSISGADAAVSPTN